MSIKKIAFLAAASLLLAGCSVDQVKQILNKREPVSTTAPIESPALIENQETTPVVEKGTNPTPTASPSDETPDMKKDLDSLKIESDFGALVQ